MVVRLFVLRAGRPLPSGRFLVLISVTGLTDSKSIVRLEGLGDLIGNRTRHRTACSMMAQPATLPHAPHT
jgi:hypothetical protein